MDASTESTAADNILIELIYTAGPDGEPVLDHAVAVSPKHVEWRADGRVLVRTGHDGWIEPPTGGPYPKFAIMQRLEAHGLREVIAHRLKDYYTFDPDVRVAMQDYFVGRETFEVAVERTIRALVMSKARHYLAHLEHLERCPTLRAQLDALMAGAPAAAPDPAPAAAPAAAAPDHGLAPRVLDLLGEIGVAAGDFHLRGRPDDPLVRRALAARRAVIRRLHAEGWRLGRIAAACRLHPKTVKEHLLAAAKTGGAS